MPLEVELNFFREHRSEWLEHYRGQYALVKDSELHGTFTTFREAFEAGVALLGNQAFLVTVVSEKDERAVIPALSVGVISARSEQIHSGPESGSKSYGRYQARRILRH